MIEFGYQLCRILMAIGIYAFVFLLVKLVLFAFKVANEEEPGMQGLTRWQVIRLRHARKIYLNTLTELHKQAEGE